jgi:hypothetical protein
MYGGGRIPWCCIEDQARSIFYVWNGVAELDMAHQAWDCVVAAGLADCGTPLEETSVKLRFLAVAAIYIRRRFGTWKDLYNPFFEEAMVDLEINPFQLGQIVGTDGPLAEKLSGLEFEWELVQAAAIALIDAEMSTLSQLNYPWPHSWSLLVRLRS